MHSINYTEVLGGVTAAREFQAQGDIAGIKKSGSKDLGLIFSSRPCTSAGAFTTNKVRAACVTANEKILPSATVQAIICNSGNANACTGQRGFDDVDLVAQAVANELSIPPQAVLSASTGIIGEFLPTQKITNTLPKLAKELSSNGAHNFAEAIMTTDTVTKEYAIEVTFSNGTARIGGCTKGAGMIAPNMATMLGFITTDVAIDKEHLNKFHKDVVDMTFNNVTVDGDTSTNDMVLVLANGASGVKIVSEDDLALFKSALFEVYNVLCAKIAEDGEGATKRIEIQVKNGLDFAACKLVAKSIANSNLVKTAMFGNDPNWGRILCAAGYSGADFDPEKIFVSLCETPVYQDGGPATFNPELLSKKMEEPVVKIVVDLGFGNKSYAVAHTCDFSYDYVKINAEYHT